MIRAAVEDDVDSLVQLIHDLAEYERSPDSAKIDSDQLRAALFCPSPTVFAHVAEEDGRIMGMAIWFLNYSTWTGRTGIALEDLYVRPGDRARGIGRALVGRLAALAHQAGYGRIDWSVLDWNQSAIRFYQSLGAVPMDEWIGYRLSGDQLDALAAASEEPGT
jgi:GNAT superfamily N-acetyltransferase